MNTFDNKNIYILGIDGLRALAVLSVMIFHVDPAYLPGGFTGVDVFFVISGYVVSGTLARSTSQSFFQFSLSFYARRIVRIVPALIVCLVIVSIVSTLFIPKSWLSNSSSMTGLSAFFGLSNFALILSNDGYFAPRVDFNSFTHTWSLAVEEQFYLIFPAIMYLWVVHRESKFLAGFFANWLLPLLLFISLIYSIFETRSSPDSAYYLLPSRFWELACGALLFKLHARRYLLPDTSIKKSFCLVVGTLLVISGFVYAQPKSFPFPWALLPTLGTAFLITGLINIEGARSGLKALYENAVLVQIGKSSYSLYLWHWPIYVFFRWTAGIDTALLAGLAIVLTFVTGNLSYYFVETPIRKNKSVLSLIKNNQNKRIIKVGLISIFGSFLFAGIVFVSQSIISLSVTTDRNVWLPKYLDFDSEDAKNETSSRNKLFVLGDSHSGAYSTMLKMLAEKHDVKVSLFSRGGCGAVNLRTPVMSSNSKCADILNKQLADIESSASPGDILFLASLRINRFGDQWELYPEEKLNRMQSGKNYLRLQKEAYQEAEQLILRLNKLQLHIIVDAPKPVFKAPPFRCSDWFNKSNPICTPGFEIDRQFLLEHRRPAMESLERLANKHSRLIIWDPFPILCSTDPCSAFENGKPLFFDGDHLSTYANKKLYPSFESQILKIWNKQN